MKHERLTGYAFALFTIIVWGSTFISSKILLTTYTPAQIMLTRFLLAYAALWLCCVPDEWHCPGGRSSLLSYWD